MNFVQVGAFDWINLDHVIAVEYTDSIYEYPQMTVEFESGVQETFMGEYAKQAFIKIAGIAGRAQ